MGIAAVAKFAHPPLLRGFQPSAQAIRSQIETSVLPQANHILARIPFFKEEGATFVTTAPSGEKLRLDDPSVRQQAVKNAIGDYWELLNIADLWFRWTSAEMPKVLKIQTSGKLHEFHDQEACQAFLFDMEGEWEEWLKHDNDGCGAVRGNT